MAVVYILRSGDEDFFKVGSAAHLESRLKQHNTSNPRLAVFRVIDTESSRAATICETYLKGILQSWRYPGSEEFYALPVTELESAIDEAERYLNEDVPRQIEVDRLARLASENAILIPGDHDWETWRSLLVARESCARDDAEKARLENRLKLAIGTASGIDGIATWRTRKKTRIDTAALKREAPGLCREFTIEITDRPFKAL